MNRTSRLSSLTVAGFLRGGGLLVALIALPGLALALPLVAHPDEGAREEHSAPVAIVNLDEPVQTGQQEDVDAPARDAGGSVPAAQTVAAGRQLAAELRDREDYLDWRLTTLDDADKGLQSGRYEAVVIIPSNFSSAVTSSSGEHPEAAIVEVQTAADASLLATRAAADAAEQAARAVADTVTESYLDNVYVGFNDISAQLISAAEGGDKLSAGTDDLSQGAADTSAGADDLADGLDALSDGGYTLEQGAAELHDGTSQLSQGARRLSDGASEVREGTRRLADSNGKLADGTRTLSTELHTLAAGASRLRDGASATKEATARVADGAAGQATSSQSLSSATTSLNEALIRLGSTCAASGAAPTYCAQVTRVAAQSHQVATGARALALGADAVAEGAAQTAAGAADVGAASIGVADGAQRAAGGADSVADGASRTANASLQLRSGAGETATGATTLASGASQTADSAGQLSGGAQELAQGAGNARSGGHKLASAAQQVAAGAAEVREGSHELSKSLHEGASQTPTYTKSEREASSAVVADPVRLDDEGESSMTAIRVATDLGESLRWQLAGLVLVLGSAVLAYSRRDRVRVLTSSARTAVSTTTRLIVPTASLGALQGLGVGVVLLVGKPVLPAAHMASACLFAMAAGAACAVVLQTMFVWLPRGGWASAVVLASAPLLGSGLVLPDAMEPPLLDAVAAVSPSKWFASGWRTLGLDSDDSLVWPAVLLVTFAFAAYLLAWMLVLRRRSRDRTVHLLSDRSRSVVT